TQEGAHKHEKSKHPYTGKGGIESHAANDVCCHQQFQSNEDRFSQVPTQSLVGRGSLPWAKQAADVDSERQERPDDQRHHSCSFETNADEFNCLLDIHDMPLDTRNDLSRKAALFTPI